LSFGLIGPATAVMLVAWSGCGDDDSPKDAGTAGKGGGEASGNSGGGKGGSSGSTSTAGTGGGSGAPTGTGTKLEGDQCATTPECGMGLTCVATRIQTSQGLVGVNVCARACAQTMECKGGAGGKGDEECLSPYTMLARDAHCINFEPDAFAICGIGETAACDGERRCLYFPDSTIGVCVDLCAQDPTQDAGVEGLVTCPGSQKCVPNVVANDALGVCGTSGPRDQSCGIEMGIFCTGTDICIPDDINAETGPEHCREDCTDTNACSSGGVCTKLSDPSGTVSFSYCKK
jgi:hypothetical protein